jgi:hypothetical protein
MSVLVTTVDSRVVPAENLVGVAELERLFTENGPQMTRLRSNVPITRQQISMWHHRRHTTKFPEAIIKHLSRGLLWDVNQFRDPDTGLMLWIGPPGRWGDDDEVDPADVHPEIPQ